jgi:hypothetical protein
MLKEISPTLDKGDGHINFKKFYECKISFRNISGKYSITNIRDWQGFDYFILCFVDTDDNFKSYFYCVPKEVITNNQSLKLTGMNNTEEINRMNKYVGKRTSIDNFDINWLFKDKSVLKGTSYKHLQDYIQKSYKSLK